MRSHLYVIMAIMMAAAMVLSACTSADAIIVPTVAAVVPTTVTATAVPPAATPVVATLPVVTHVVVSVVSPTATLAGDPRSSLGNPTWKDTFQNGKNWDLESPYDDGNTRAEILNNSLVLTSANANGWLGWRLSYLTPRNFYLEATIQTKVCSGNDQYGLIFRAPDKSSGYWMGVTCDGQYFLLSGDGGALTELIKAKPSDAIHAGSNQTNRLGVMIKDSSITLYANGKLLDQVTDTTYPNAGTFGLFIAGQKTLNFSFACTEIDYWEQ